MDHKVEDVNYRFVLQGDHLHLEKLVEVYPHKMRQWMNVLSGSVQFEEVDGHHDGFTVGEMRMFIEHLDVIRKGRE